MNSERLRIEQVDRTPSQASTVFAWDVRYKGWSENPLSWDEIDGNSNGQSEVLVDTVLAECRDVTQAIRWARSWAAGSGFKVGPLKPDGGNTFEIKLRRP